VDERHVNMRGVLHGAMLMTFADLALGQAAWDATDHAAVVTLNMQSQFVKATHLGDLVEVAPDLIRRTGSLLFLRGDFIVASDIIFTVSTVWKVINQN
jgi:acyl-coenzyme A thioesterase PaaI-like protein